MDQQRLEDWQASFAPRPGESKVTTMAEAIRMHVRPGMTLHYAYAHARPNALLMELVRQYASQEPRFTLVAPSIVGTQTALIASGIVSKLICSFAGETYPSASPNKMVRAAVASGDLELENWSLWTWVARLQAGALGVPFFPVKSLAGSGMARDHLGTDYAVIANPFGNNEPVSVVSGIRPDLTFLHGVAGDEEGNVVLSAPFGEAQWGALAAREGVIASVERIASPAEIRRHRTDVRVPAHVVRAVCHAPLGSHPYGLFDGGFAEVAGYVEDAEFMGAVAVATRDPARFSAWLGEWILGTRDHVDYLYRLGASRIAALRGAASSDAWLLDIPAAELLRDPQWTSTEAMIVSSARQIATRLRQHGHRTVLAGVGFSHLASWLAKGLAARQNQHVQLLTEIGMYGYDPMPGEPFIFSGRNMHTCSSLVDVAGMLGGIVSGPDNRCLGAIGAALIDASGNVGSTWTNTGEFIIGSGGANDIASAADEVLVTVPHSPQRMVESVDYVTSPGDRVRCVVTSMGIFERADAESPFTLVRIMPGLAATAADALALIRGNCSWHYEISSQLSVEPEPEAFELALIRSYDPRRTILEPLPRDGDNPATADRHPLAN
jgi:acyl CoA:acetate/3-ketoacid CoA transferase alpha subunit/acyl CoA:acetate/3-ketoacid CoA transferase beta subunit